MKKIEKASELLWILGLIFVAFGVAVCGKADLGVSMIAAPAFVVSEALLPFVYFFSVGVTEYILQGVLLIVLCVVIKRFNWRYLLTFAVAVIYGYTLNLFLWLLKDVTVNAIYLRWIMLVLGDICVGFGVACFFCTNMPIQAHEMFVKEVVNKFSLNLNKTKWGFDIAFLAISVVLALALFDDARTFDWSQIWYKSFHNMGLGTLVTTVINSPIIKMWCRVVDKFFGSEPKFSKINKFLNF